MDHIERHYSVDNLEPAILAALTADGKDVDRLSQDDLAPVDEFHIRGREATRELAALVQPGAGQKVLDLGSGLGGAARFLASEYRCHVIGLDLTPTFCRVARSLTARVGLGALVHNSLGSAAELPFATASFDVVWTQHATMNIAAKVRLYLEIARVLRPGGLFAMYDILAGPAGSPHYPVPWAREPSVSHLIHSDQLRDLLVQSGLEILSWRDTSELGLVWFRELSARYRAGAPRPALGLQLLLGGETREMSLNQVRNLEEGRILLIECVARAQSKG